MINERREGADVKPGPWCRVCFLALDGMQDFDGEDESRHWSVLDFAVWVLPSAIRNGSARS